MITFLSVAVILLLAALGLAVGSFLNVVVWRVPQGLSVVNPPSACPRCFSRINPRDNIPVLSWLALRGRCRACAEPISARYPLVELGTGTAFVVVGLSIGFDAPGVWAIPAFLYLGAISIALALIDIDTHTLPNRIIYPSYAIAAVLLGVASAATSDWFALVRGVIGAAALFSFYLLLAIITPRGMGFGDVKLAGILGLYLGWLGWGALAVGTFAAFLLGGVFSIGLIVFRKAGRKTGIPFGPWMLSGAIFGAFFGEDLAVGYLGLVGLR